MLKIEDFYSSRDLKEYWDKIFKSYIYIYIYDFYMLL